MEKADGCAKTKVGVFPCKKTVEALATRLTNEKKFFLSYSHESQKSGFVKSNSN